MSLQGGIYAAAMAGDMIKLIDEELNLTLHSAETRETLKKLKEKLEELKKTAESGYY